MSCPYPDLELPMDHLAGIKAQLMEKVEPMTQGMVATRREYRRARQGRQEAAMLDAMLSLLDLKLVRVEEAESALAMRLARFGALPARHRDKLARVLEHVWALAGKVGDSLWGLACTLLRTLLLLALVAHDGLQQALQPLPPLAAQLAAREHDPPPPQPLDRTPSILSNAPNAAA